MNIMLPATPFGPHDYNGQSLKEWRIGYIAGGSQRVTLIWENGAAIRWIVEIRNRNGVLIADHLYRGKSPTRALKKLSALLGGTFKMEKSK